MEYEPFLDSFTHDLIQRVDAVSTVNPFSGFCQLMSIVSYIKTELPRQDLNPIDYKIIYAMLGRKLRELN